MAVLKKSKPELAHIVKHFGRALMQKYTLSPMQVKALNNILQCRTSALGGHEEMCVHCGEKRYSYNSCGDRHCPKCQISKQALWAEDISRLTLPVKHYHIIFTVPHDLNQICLWNPKMYYDILFSAVGRTLHSFGYTHYGVESGAIAVLHSWGQNLSLHPHIHCLVPAAGYSLQGKWKNIGRENFLYPIFQLSDDFKDKFLKSLKRKLKKMDMYQAFYNQLQKAWKARWVVNIEPPMADAKHVIHYLSQYVHRVAISNHRILEVTQSHVRFVAKDYRDNAQHKHVRLEGVEFLHRFCQHVFPKGFVRIRRYGIYNATTIRRHDLKFRSEQELEPKSMKTKARKERAVETIRRITGYDPCVCPRCKKGPMRVIAVIPRIRSPAANLPQLLMSKLA